MSIDFGYTITGTDFGATVMGTAFGSAVERVTRDGEVVDSNHSLFIFT